MSVVLQILSTLKNFLLVSEGVMKMHKFYKTFDKYKQLFYDKNLYTSVVYLDNIQVRGDYN